MVTREIDVLFAVCWAFFAIWGIASGIEGLPSVQQQAGHGYSFFWSFGVGVSALGATASAVAIFFKSRFGQVTKKRLERTFCWALLLFIAYYPIALTLSDNWVPAILILIFMALPIYRIRHLSYRIKLYHVSAASL